MIIAHAGESILLRDSSKFDKMPFYRICGFQDISCMITNAGPNDGLLSLLTENSAKLLSPAARFPSSSSDSCRG